MIPDSFCPSALLLQDELECFRILVPLLLLLCFRLDSVFSSGSFSLSLINDFMVLRRVRADGTISGRYPKPSPTWFFFSMVLKIAPGLLLFLQKLLQAVQSKQGGQEIRRSKRENKPSAAKTLRG